MADQRISEQQLQALDDADEYSLRHHSSEVSLLVESYRGVCAELEVAHIACQLSVAENIQLRGEVKRLNSLPQDWLAADLVKHLVDKAQTLNEGAGGQMDDFAIVLLASAERLQRQEAVIDQLRKDGERYRWLRDKSESLHSFYLSIPIWMTGVRFRQEDVDRSIDAAMAEGGAHG